jgi:omega-amidase
MLLIIVKEACRLTTFKNLVALQFAYETKSLEQNLQTLVSLINKAPDFSIITAPELCLSGYNYEHLQKSADFSQKIIPTLKELSQTKLISLTLVQKIGKNFYNQLQVFYKEKIIHARAKTKLFPLGKEEKFFKADEIDKIKIIEVEGIKLAFLVCFELRFSELWRQIQGSDVICIPAFWGKQRKEHFETLTKSLAIMNQAYVVTANSSDESMASSSGIITPFGQEIRDDAKQLLQSRLNLHEIKKMRKYINIGL